MEGGPGEEEVRKVDEGGGVGGYRDTRARIEGEGRRIERKEGGREGGRGGGVEGKGRGKREGRSRD